MLLLSGTLPVGHDDSITVGPVRYDGASMSVGSREIPREMRSIGATALMAAAVKTAEALGMETPIGLVAGDTGDGSGSRLVYRYLIEKAGGLGVTTVTMHYILPLRKEFMDFVEMTDYWQRRPFLIADAGALLIAKATGLCT